MGKRSGWFGKVTDRVPTKWFAAGTTVIFLAATAAFGGLADKPAPPLPRLDMGVTHEGPLFDITVDRVIVLDSMPEIGMKPQPGQRVLGVVATVTNRWTNAIISTGDSLAKSLEIDALPGVPASNIVRLDDQTSTPWLQPGVPVQLAMLWTIDAGLARDGETLPLRILDGTLYKGSFVISGYRWVDFTTSAYVDATVKDNGAAEGKAE